MASGLGVLGLESRCRQLTENLAHETARYGVCVFSVHPGQLPIGLSATVIGGEPANEYEKQISVWTINELSEGRGAQPAQAVDLVMRVANGDADSLSGRRLSVHDDLDALLARRNVASGAAQTRTKGSIARRSNHP